MNMSDKELAHKLKMFNKTYRTNINELVGLYAKYRNLLVEIQYIKAQLTPTCSKGKVKILLTKLHNLVADSKTVSLHIDSVNTTIKNECILRATLFKGVPHE